jgi:glycosyltransferase involved in cell wall biosynthesis
MQWHLLTGEFPPQPGGVSDYTLSVARGLAAAGTTVHVWCPGVEGTVLESPGLVVHRVAGTWSQGDLWRVDREMDTIRGPRRLLVQWVPQAYGYRSLNLGFCRWVRARGRKGDVVELMAHEAYLAFGEGPWVQNGAAAVHRVMVSLLLSVARRVWVSIPAWTRRLRPYTLGRHVEFCWLPVPSNVPVVGDADRVQAARTRFAPAKETLVGHFGTYGATLRRDLEPLIRTLTGSAAPISVVLMGRDSEQFLNELVGRFPGLSDHVRATGAVPPDELSVVLQACDLVVQPYPDGASSRRGTLMAALAHGVAVVTTEGRLSESVWRETGAVRLVGPEDSAALSHAAIALCGDAEARATLSRAGRALYAERFDLSHTIHALMAGSCQAA